MGTIEQYKCPKCDYETPRLYVGCGFNLSYGVYVCKRCQTVENILTGDGSEWIDAKEINNTHHLSPVDFTPRCTNCGNKELEEWDMKHCPRCVEEMIWGGKYGDNFLCGDWD